MARKFEFGFGTTVLNVGEDVMRMKLGEPHRAQAINFARALVKDLYRRNAWAMCMHTLVPTSVWELKPQPCYFYPFEKVGRSFVVRYDHARALWEMNVHHLPPQSREKLLPWHAAWENPAPNEPEPPPPPRRRRSGQAERYANAAIRAALRAMLGGILYVLHRIPETPSFEHIVSAIGARVRRMWAFGGTLATHANAIGGEAVRFWRAQIHNRVTRFSECAARPKVRQLEERLFELWPGFSLALGTWADDEPDWDGYLFGRLEDERVTA